jgi:hypothetical protein
VQARIFAEVDTRAIALPADAAHAAKQLKQVALGWSGRNDKRAAAALPRRERGELSVFGGFDSPSLPPVHAAACCPWPLVRDTLAAEQGH